MSKSILVVDDDASTRGMVRSVLSRQGYDVEVVNSGNEAIARLTSNRDDAVVLDVMMPDGSGHEVLQVLKVQRPDVKCVVVISAASTAQIDEVEIAKVEAKLRKPFDIEELVQAVEKCVGPPSAVEDPERPASAKPTVLLTTHIPPTSL